MFRGAASYRAEDRSTRKDTTRDRTRKLNVVLVVVEEEEEKKVVVVVVVLVVRRILRPSGAYIRKRSGDVCIYSVEDPRSPSA